MDKRIEDMDKHCRDCVFYEDCKKDFYSDIEYEKYDFDESCLVCDNLTEEEMSIIEQWIYCTSYEKDCEHCPHYSAEDEVCNFDK